MSKTITIKDMTTITIKNHVLDSILLNHMLHVADGAVPHRAAIDCKQEIIESSVSMDDEIKAQAEALSAELKERYKHELADAKDMQRHMLDEEMAREKQVLTNTFQQKIDRARQQGLDQGAKEAVSMRQQLEDAYRKNAQLGKMLVQEKDPFTNKHPDVFVVDKLKELGGNTQRTKDGVYYYPEQGGAILICCRKTTFFQTAWLKEIKQSMQEPLANYAIIVSVCQPGPRQRKELKDANRAGVYVCQPENVHIVADMLREWLVKEQKQALVQSAKQDSAGALYDWVTGGEMQVMQSMLQDSLKAKAKAIRGLETQIAHLKSAMDKEVEVSNQVFTKMIEKSGVQSLPESK